MLSLNSLFHPIYPDPNQVMAMQGMGDEEAMMNLAIALSLNEVCCCACSLHTHIFVEISPVINQNKAGVCGWVGGWMGVAWAEIVTSSVSTSKVEGIAILLKYICKILCTMSYVCFRVVVPMVVQFPFQFS